MPTLRERMERLVEGKSSYALPKPLPMKKLKPALLDLLGTVEAAEKQAEEAKNKIHGLAYSKADALNKRGVEFFSDEEGGDSATYRALVAIYRTLGDDGSLHELRSHIQALPDED
jgi:hypothetical protein